MESWRTLNSGWSKELALVTTTYQSVYRLLLCFRIRGSFRPFQFFTVIYTFFPSFFLWSGKMEKINEVSFFLLFMHNFIFNGNDCNLHFVYCWSCCPLFNRKPCHLCRKMKQVSLFYDIAPPCVQPTRCCNLKIWFCIFVIHKNCPLMYCWWNLIPFFIYTRVYI